MKHATLTWFLCATAGLMVGTPAHAADNPAEPPANPAAVQELPQVIVIGNAPLPGIGLPLNQVAGDVQTVSAADLKRQQTLGVPDFLNNNLAGVSLSESQNNPLQPDINYHGFTASPLLGTPQGLSVYVDGVRVNEAFGDTVNWDLIPDIAIANITLAGSNPVYGLNTLGGALTVQTRSGHDFPGTDIQAYGGSFGRYAIEGATGGSSGPFDYFLAAHSFNDDGWRDFSPSRVKQVFAKVGYQDDKTDVDLSYTYANTSLVGNGAAPLSLLDVRRAAIYTTPDFTGNTLNFVVLTGSRFLSSDLVVSGNLYYRSLATQADNGDANDDNYQSDDFLGSLADELGPAGSRAVIGAIDCASFTYAGTPEVPTIDPLVPFAYCAPGINRTSTTTQHTVGAGLQATATRDLFGLKNQAVLGASFDHATVGYTQTFQYAHLTPGRGVAIIDAPANPAFTVNDISGGAKVFGLYLTDTLSPSSWVHVTVSARYNHIQESLGGQSLDTDLGGFSTHADDNQFYQPELLSGDHSYSRVNPFIGFTITPSRNITFFANYNEGSRAPTILELGCSNPEQPCGLPNDFASDPDLRQVVSRTFEIGARGSLADEVLDWSVDLFHTHNQNDIQFVAATTTEGYFANVGSTRRQGLDLALGGKIVEGLRWRFVYSFVDATYQSSFLVNAGSNSTADDDGNIQVKPGARIPLIPRHTARLRLDYSLGNTWDAGASLIISSGVFLHGNENNANVPDDSVIGTGRIPGYFVVNLDTTWHATKSADLFARIVNLFDRHYATAGFLSTNAFNPDGSFRTSPDDWTNENLVSPGMPVAVWVGARIHW